MAKVTLSWEEKLKQGIPLNELEETKYAATRNTLRRLAEQEAERKFQAQKASDTLEPLYPVSPEKSEVVLPEDSKQKKGN